MKFDLKLQPGNVVDNAELCEIFKCSPQGGMRRSLRTGTLVIISNQVESIYNDRWNKDVLHYTGMGLKGDQSFNFAQNRTVYESDSNGVQMHLFEVHFKNEYTYRGKVKLAARPYFETQPDMQGFSRTVCVFPLKLTKDGNE